MKQVFAALCSALILSASPHAGAQPPTAPTPAPPAPRPQGSPPSMQKRSNAPIVVLACLVPWSDAMAGAGADASVPEHRYVLADAEPEAAQPPADGQPATAPVTAERYIVTAVGGVNLAEYVNKRVRVVGTVIDDPTAPRTPADPEATPPPADPRGNPPTAAPTPAPPASRWPALVAASVTTAGAACRPGAS
jgi:hypothetical protein